MGDKRVLASAMITAFMTTFMSSALNLSVPALESYFGVSAAAISWIVSAYTIAVAATSLPMGKIADITSRRMMFLIGIAGFGILSAACIFVRHIGALIAMRVLMGTCAGMIFSTNNAILISSYPQEKRGHVIGFSTAATYVGLTAGPVLGGVLNSTLGWRSIFAASVLVSASAFIAALRSGYRDKGPGSEAGKIPRAGFDSIGASLYMLAITASLYGMGRLGNSAAGAFAFGIGIAGLAAFFVHESRQDDPIMKVSMFSRSRTFTFSCLAALLNYGATFAISYTMSIYLQVILGISSGRAGIILITMPAVQAVFSPLMGGLSDRIRPAVLASTGMGICALTLLMFSRFNGGTAMASVILALCLTGLGFAFFSSPNTNAILGCVEARDYGVTNSIIATMRTYGQSSGMAILNVITVSVLGSGSLESSPAADILRMMHTAFIIFAGLSILGLFFSLARDR